MPRIRYLKPDFFTDEDLAELPYQTRLFFAGMWCQADKAGRLQDRPKKLKAVIFPYDNVDAEKCLQQLAQPKNGSGKPFINRYEADGQRYIQILTWDEHQKPHHTEKDSQIPSPPHTPPMEKGMGMEKQLEASTELSNGEGTVKQPLSREFEDDFWPNVPNKIGKGKAREAYLKARKKTDEATILAGLPAYRAYEAKRAKQADYRPLHPATWLNQERWADETPGQKPQELPTACACGCGRWPTIQRENKWWASSQCYYKSTKE